MPVESLTYAALGAHLTISPRGRSFACQATPVDTLVCRRWQSLGEDGRAAGSIDSQGQAARRLGYLAASIVEADRTAWR